MLQDTLNDSSLKSSLFSESRRYPVDLNLPFGSKASTIMSEARYTKPFFHREKKSTKSSKSSDCNTSESLKKNGTDKPNVESNVNGKIEDKNDDQQTKPVSSLRASENHSDVNAANIETPEPVDSTTTETKHEDKHEHAAPSKTVPRLMEKVTSEVTDGQGQANHQVQSAVFVPTLPTIPPIYIPHGVSAFPSPPMQPLVNPLMQSQFLPCAPSFKGQGKSKGKDKQSFQQGINMPSYNLQQNGSNREYYVMVHVDAGATFSIRTGEHIQHFPGKSNISKIFLVRC